MVTEVPPVQVKLTWSMPSKSILYSPIALIVGCPGINWAVPDPACIFPFTVTTSEPLPSAETSTNKNL